MDLAAAAATGVLQLSADRIWQGKRTDGDAGVAPLSKKERSRVKKLAVSVWDDDDEEAQGWFLQPNQNRTFDNLYDGKE